PAQVERTAYRGTKDARARRDAHEPVQIDAVGGIVLKMLDKDIGEFHLLNVRLIWTACPKGKRWLTTTLQLDVLTITVPGICLDSGGVLLEGEGPCGIQARTQKVCTACLKPGSMGTRGILDEGLVERTLGRPQLSLE